MSDIERTADGSTISLFIAAQGGQAEARDRLVRRLERRLHGFARSVKGVLGRGIDIQTLELADDALFNLLRRPPAGGVTGSGHLVGLLIRRMRQIVIGRLRRERAAKRGGGIAHRPLSEAADVVRSEDRGDGNLALLEKALDRLEQVDPLFHQAVVLRTVEELGWESVSQCMGVSVATARRHWESGLEWLRTYLEDESKGE